MEYVVFWDVLVNGFIGYGEMRPVPTLEDAEELTKKLEKAKLYANIEIVPAKKLGLKIERKH